MLIEKYSFGIGDRFGKQGEAQLAAIQKINGSGYNVVPVWNKSHREHTIVKTTQKDVLTEAEAAVKNNSWLGNFYIDADHINLDNVDAFLDYSNFFTIDVAKYIGKTSEQLEKEAFIKRHSNFVGKLVIPEIDEEFQVSEELLGFIADNYLKAIQEVKTIYDYIVSKKGKGNFIPEVSMDECDIAQTPLELFFILAEIKNQGIEIQTIAPKFTGLFPKGVDYVGDLDLFAKEFEQDLAVLKFAAGSFALPSSLKLSVHSGSDKFSIYPAMRDAIKKFDAGIHVKTAGTTWLEEVIGLAKAGDEGLKIAKKVYERSFARFDELTGPYASVLDIDKAQLPPVELVNSWASEKFSKSLIHDQNCDSYNRNFRQLIHVGYKIAVELGKEYEDALDKYQDVISENVTLNLYERHLKLLFD